MGSDLATPAPQLDEVLRTLSPEQLKFVERRIYERTDADTARVLGMSAQTVYNWDNKADVNLAVQLAKVDGVHIAKERLHRLMGKAIDGLELELDNRRNRLDAVREVLDRTLGKPVQKNEHGGKDGGPIDVTIDAKERLAQLIDRRAASGTEIQGDSGADR